MKYSKRLNVFISPTVGFLVLLSVFPFVYALVLSFSAYNLSSNPHIEFVGIANYVNLFKDRLFLTALRNTVLFVMAATFFEVLFGTLLALGLFNFLRRTRKPLQAIMVVPMAMTPVAAALMWKYMYNSTYGVLNYGLSLVGISQVDWLGSTQWSLMSIVIVDIWQWTPFVLLILLAGLESIPHQLLDMARIDGANRFQLTTYFVFPQIKYFLWIAILLRAIDSMKTFDTVYVLTAGGPGSSTETLSSYGYKLGFSFFNTGYAAAESMVLLAMVTFLTWLLMKSFRRVR